MASPLFPFGFALQYTSFTLSALAVTPSTQPGQALDVQVTVANTGARSSQATVFIFARDPLYEINTITYWKRLVGFAKVAVPAGGQTIVHVAVAVADLAIYDDAMQLRVVPGTYFIQAAADSTDPGLGQTITL